MEKTVRRSIALKERVKRLKAEMRPACRVLHGTRYHISEGGPRRGNKAVIDAGTRRAPGVSHGGPSCTGGWMKSLPWSHWWNDLKRVYVRREEAGVRQDDPIPVVPLIWGLRTSLTDMLDDL